jgi:DMSO reductase anchor subunit
MVTMETLAAISIDRCLAIKSRTAYRTIVTKRRVIIFLVFAWIFGFAVVIISIQFARVKTLLFTTALNMVLLLSIMTIAYSMSFRALKKLSSQVIQSANRPNQPHADFNAWKYKRSLNTMVMILALSLLSYLPMILYNLMSLLVYKSVAMRHLAEFLITFNSTLNPILCLWRMKDLRDAAKQILF